jgi:hypothetical protein
MLVDIIFHTLTHHKIINTVLSELVCNEIVFHLEITEKCTVENK